ncbi:MAG: type IV pilus secretin PilQ [Xanthomonadales bacterium]|nr:type IV pilus secretin PilQ [Xanthomonadales bacterium]
MKIKTRDHNMLSSWVMSAGLLLSMVWSVASAQATLEEVTFNTSAGGAVDVVLEISGSMPEPAVFTTDNPARIAIDLPNTASNLDSRDLSVGVGSTRSVTAVEAGDRTRVVIDLFRSVPFDTRTEGDRFIVSVQGSGAASQAVTSADRRFVPGAASASEVAVSNIDFRRGANGEARIIVDFSGPGANIDLSRQGDQLNAVIYNASLPSELEQRLDVMDFATPVRMVDSFTDGNRVRVVVDFSGEIEHLAYQSGDRYVIEVQEFEEEELTPEQMLLQEPEYTGTRVTFNFQDIPVRAVLQLIADVSGLNVVVADSVDGSITLRLQNVPWDQALDIILQAKSLDQRKVGNVVWIAPAEEIAAREQQQLAALQEKRRLEPVRSAFIQVNYAKATDLATLIQEARGASSDDGDGGGILSSRGSVSVDERTNVLLVTDTQDRIAEIRELVNLLDRPVRQVQIESRIVVATDNFSDELGARFGLTSSYEDNDGNLVGTTGSIFGTDRMANLGLVNRNTNPNGAANPVVAPGVPPGGIANPPITERLNVNLPASAANASTWSLGILAADYLLDLELSALEQEGRGEVVSSPRLITANQKQASITQGVEIPYQESASSGAATVSFKEAVLELDVQPLITPDDRVILDLTVKKDAIGEFVPVQGGGQVPSIDKRVITTQVLIDSGQTVVLGGIFERERRYESDRVPVLGDIPGLGVLFRNRLEQDAKSELLIFVTPTILTENVGAY